MTPPASVSGLYFWHPQAKYFSIQRVKADQVQDYARRIGLSVEDDREVAAAGPRLRPLAGGRALSGGCR